MKEDTSLFERVVLRLAGARVLILFLFHAVVFASAYAFSYLVRFDFVVPADYVSTFRSSLIVVAGIQLLIGVAFGFYRGWWRYVGIGDVIRLVFGLSTATAILVVLWYVGAGTFGIHERFVRSPRGVLLIDWAFSLLGLFGARVLIRIGRDRFRPEEMPNDSRRVLIVGAGDAGESLAREIQHRPQLGMKVVGFVDDQRAKWGAHIRGIKVSGPIASIGAIAGSSGADEALLAIPSASGKRIREIIHQLSEADLTFKTIPGIDHLVSGKVHASELRPVNIEDLMRRKKIELPGDPVRQLFTGRRVLVTGAGGTIGSELCAQILEFEPESLALIERSELALYEVRKRLTRDARKRPTRITANLIDICDPDIVEALIEREKPQIVLHAAAHKHVPLGEENPTEYLRNNTLATRSLGEICAKHWVERFVFISTDKAINPASIMGATKRAAEILLLDLARMSDMKVTIVRFGNVIGSSGSVIPLFMEQIAAGGPVTITHPDVTRYFIRTSEAISLVLQAATLGNDGEIFMLDMGEPVKIVDLARDLIRLSSRSEHEIPIVFTGLRPGEKLFEEIRLNHESARPTEHPQIVVTSARQPQGTRVRHWMIAAEKCADGNQARRQLKDLAPECIWSPPPLDDAPTIPAAVPIHPSLAT
ncbi:MAG TPA: nucleoside-diphosphate sugar epimerase/dehydratase [Thermoanaerobaculia bacterium]|nr:nucleoside-diphosphate sugar epimerase/dehydratase [Thermoanaerobaculia bacterium]